MKSRLIFLTVLLVVTVFDASAWCDTYISYGTGWSSPPGEFGTVLTGSTICKNATYTNRKTESSSVTVMAAIQSHYQQGV